MCDRLNVVREFHLVNALQTMPMDYGSRRE